MQRARTHRLPAAPGTYLLILESFAERRVAVGALGILLLERGFYAYVGSAFGSGGLRARLGHHCRRARSPRWHVDHLRRHTAPRQAWLCPDAIPREHVWAEALGADPRVHVPLAGFGASDCACRSHLFWLGHRPDRNALRGILASRAQVLRRVLL